MRVTGEHTQERRLAGAVGPDEREKAPVRDLDGHVVEDGRRPDAIRDVPRGDRRGGHAHPPARRRLRRMSQKKKGPPMSEVRTPIGRSAAGTMVRARRSA